MVQNDIYIQQTVCIGDLGLGFCEFSAVKLCQFACVWLAFYVFL